jgi:hypothetical protein
MSDGLGPGEGSPNTTPGYHRIESWVRARELTDPPAEGPLKQRQTALVVVDESVHLVDADFQPPAKLPDEDVR